MVESRIDVAARHFQPGEAPPNKGRRFPPEILTPEEARRLLRACSHRSPSGIRNRALLVVMYRAGLRIGEALALKPGDVDSRAGTVRILHGKGDRSRVVGLDPTAMSVLDRWLEKRRQLGIRGRYVFCTLQGGQLDASYVRALLGRLAAKAGLDKRVNPHALRHTHAAELAAEGTPVSGQRRRWLRLDGRLPTVLDRFQRRVEATCGWSNRVTSPTERGRKARLNGVAVRVGLYPTSSRVLVTTRAARS